MQVSTEVLDKPLILEEFGQLLPTEVQDSENDIKKTRDPLYSKTLGLVAEEIMNNGNVGGALFWRLHLSTYEGRGRGMKLVFYNHLKFFQFRNLHCP